MRFEIGGSLGIGAGSGLGAFARLSSCLGCPRPRCPVSAALGRRPPLGQAPAVFAPSLAAECFRTCATEAFLGREYVKVIERLNDHKTEHTDAYFPEVDGRTHRRKKKLYFRNVSVLYGERARHPEEWHLSPYEFVTHWQPVLTSFPQSLADADNAEHHVLLTSLGRQKLFMQEA